MELLETGGIGVGVVENALSETWNDIDMGKGSKLLIEIRNIRP